MIDDEVVGSPYLLLPMSHMGSYEAVDEWSSPGARTPTRSSARHSAQAQRHQPLLRLQGDA